jgi:conjugative relaxase-like TrwC/TraI family protein
VRVFHGRHPETGELLGRPHGDRGVPAFYVVLRPTKSVSLLYGLGDPRIAAQVLDAHHQATAEALGYLEDHVGARRGHGGCDHVQGNGLVAVGFNHRTSRAGDPLLHTHVIVANRVQGPDGRWTALDGRDLYRHRLAADAIYRGAYQRALSRSLGVAWSKADRWATGSWLAYRRSCWSTSELLEVKHALGATFLKGGTRTCGVACASVGVGGPTPTAWRAG